MSELIMGMLMIICFLIALGVGMGMACMIIIFFLELPAIIKSKLENKE